MGLEGIVSQRLGSRDGSGRSRDRLNSKIQTLLSRDERWRRTGIGNDHCWAGLQRPVAQTLRVPLAAFGQVDDGLGDRLAGRIELSPVAPGLDGGFESKAHATRGFGVESLTFQVGPYRHSGKNLFKIFRL
jgi:hypothetical protein